MATMINGQLILEEENYQATEEDIFEYAQCIGIDPLKEKDLLFIAREGIAAPLPPGWKPCQDANAEIYYFNFRSGDSIWDHPCDEYYRNMVKEERQRRSAMGASKKDGGKKNKTSEGSKQKTLSAGLAPLKGEGSLGPLRDSSPAMSLGTSLGASSTGRGNLGGAPLGSLGGLGPLGGGSLGKGSLGGASLGGGINNTLGAKASSLADKLEKHLECAVCLEQYNEPKVLPCLHTFCKTCLQGLLTKQRDAWKVVCPTCRAVAEVPNGVIDSLPVNFFVNNLLSDVALHGDSKTAN